MSDFGTTALMWEMVKQKWPERDTGTALEFTLDHPHGWVTRNGEGWVKPGGLTWKHWHLYGTLHGPERDRKMSWSEDGRWICACRRHRLDLLNRPPE